MGEGVTYDPIRHFFSNFSGKIGKFPLFWDISGIYFTFFGHFIHGSDRNKILLGDHYYQRSQNLARINPFENPRGAHAPRPPHQIRLWECSRVTLPKPLGIVREAQIETRRNIHRKIFMQYKREKCNRDGEQVTNLSEEEQRGLKSLMKKIKEDKILIMKTDKSGKLAVTTKEKYT